MILSWFKSNKTIDEVPKVPVEEISVQVEGDIEFIGVGFSVRDVYVHTNLNLKVSYSTSDYMNTLTLDNIIKYIDIKGENWTKGIEEEYDSVAYDIAIKEVRKFNESKEGVIMEELKKKIKLAIIDDIESENLENKRLIFKQLPKQEINLSFKFTK